MATSEHAIIIAMFYPVYSMYSSQFININSVKLI